MRMLGKVAVAPTLAAGLIAAGTTAAHCPGMIRAALQASPWGLTGHGFAAFAARSPGNSVAALASYWVTHTEGHGAHRQPPPPSPRQGQ